MIRRGRRWRVAVGGGPGDGWCLEGKLEALAPPEVRYCPGNDAEAPVVTGRGCGQSGSGASSRPRSRPASRPPSRSETARLPAGTTPGEAFDRLRRRGALPAGLTTDVAAARYALMRASIGALARHTPSGPYPGRVTLIDAEDSERPAAGWAAIAGPEATVAMHLVPGDHHTMWDPAHIAGLAALVRRALEPTSPAGAGGG